MDNHGDGSKQETFAQARDALKQGYTAAGLVLLDENDTSFTVEYHGIHFAITRDDIEDYAESASLRESCEVAPTECAMTGPEYREQVVQPLDPIRWRYLPPLEMGFRFGEPNDETAYITIGAASTEFVNFFRFDPVYLDICLERMSRAPSNGTPVDIRHGLYRPPTLRVHNLAEKNIKNALKSSSDLINYCLFELAYLKHLPAGLADEWPARRRLANDSFNFGDEFEGTVLPMPSAEFNADVVQFYQLGVSSRVPVLQFWSFYQAIEYFFVRASDEDLHDTLASRLKDPRFKPSSTQLDRLVQDVIDHLDTTDPLSMLINVLEKYVDEDELIQFIKAYESYLGEDLYTHRRRLFGEDLQVKLTSGTVLENVARTIMAIRQMVVYSPDRFSRTARNIGIEQLNETIRSEIPLMKFLAERVIIGSAS